MDHHGRAVVAQPHIELERVGAALRRQIEGIQRILRSEARGSAMSDHRTGVEIEEWVHVPPR